MEKNFKMLAKTFYGMEKILAVELKQLGAVDVYEGNRLVHFKGDKGFMYKANLCLRTALKILKPIFQFQAKNEGVLYENFIITIGVVYSLQIKPLPLKVLLMERFSTIHFTLLNAVKMPLQIVSERIMEKDRWLISIIQTFDFTFTFLIKNAVYPLTPQVTLYTIGVIDT